jgi:flagellar motor component MotA
MPTAIRIFSIVCVLAFIAGANRLVGGSNDQLWQVRPFAAILCLAFMMSAHRIGFRSTFTGYMSAVFGQPQNRDDGLNYFHDSIQRWTMRAAHIFALLNLVQVAPTINDYARLGTHIGVAVSGYVYAIVLGFLLRGRHNRDKQDRVQFVDAVLPALCLAVCYFALRYLTK